MNRHAFKEDIRIIKKHKMLNIDDLWKIQIKTTRYHFKPTKMTTN